MEVSFSADELRTIQDLLQLRTFELKIDFTWGSQNLQFRELLYGELNHHLSKLNSYSISHTQSLGGFVFTEDSGVQLGFDIEVSDRVTEEVARRVSQNPAEYNSAPGPAILWTAKEAAYKAVKGPHQPTVLSEINVGDWAVFQSQFETFQFVRQDPRAKFLNCGVAISKQLYTFAFFKFTP